ncbi:MAG: gliding motility lipoprotein GldH [Bacteroidales bacterium]|nr:gliding motility lipoprotein GldH [Bacteroidales bacterium]
MNRFSFLWVFLFVFILTGCHHRILYESSVRIPSEGWAADRMIRFAVPVTDTAGYYDLFIQVRNNRRYAYANLWLFVRTTAPTGATVRDTLECPLADNQGRWLGRGVAHQFAIEMPFKYRVKFPFPGTYRFEVQQGMREELLKHISDIGLKIEKSK